MVLGYKNKPCFILRLWTHTLRKLSWHETNIRDDCGVTWNSKYLVIFLICQGSEKYMENFFLKKGAQKIKPEINRLSSVPSTSWVSTLIQLLSLIEKRRRRGGVGWIACVFLRENWDAKRQGKYAPLHTVHFLCWKKCQMYYLRLCQLQSVCLPPIFSFLTSMFVVFLMRWWFF